MLSTWVQRATTPFITSSQSIILGVVKTWNWILAFMDRFWFFGKSEITHLTHVESSHYSYGNTDSISINIINLLIELKRPEGNVWSLQLCCIIGLFNEEAYMLSPLMLRFAACWNVFRVRGYRLSIWCIEKYLMCIDRD